MQPFRPHEREAFRKKGVTEEEIDEYQALLVQRFATPTGAPLSPEAQQNADRLAELWKKMQ